MNNKISKCLSSTTRLLTAGLFAGLFCLHVPAFADDYTTVNKRVSVESGVVTDEISSVNGRVTVGDNVTADEISSVNGKVLIGNGVNAGEVSTVNGKIEISDDVSVRKSVEAVNGTIKIDAGSNIGEDVSTVNGTISLSEVTVERMVKTINGSIYLTDGTSVKGDIVIGAPNSNKRWNKGWNGRPPKLLIDANSTVDGKIIVYREVEYDFVDSSLMDKVEDRSDES
ncbi:MAG: hypothetical protein AAGJ37_06320 [Pseudomonadota bacterium]